MNCLETMVSMEDNLRRRKAKEAEEEKESNIKRQRRIELEKQKHEERVAENNAFVNVEAKYRNKVD